MLFDYIIVGSERIRIGGKRWEQFAHIHKLLEVVVLVFCIVFRFIYCFKHAVAWMRSVVCLVHVTVSW